jgi:predicted dehydrogenase
VTGAQAPVRIGVVGLGRMGQNHVRVLSLLAGVELGFVYDLDPATTEAVAARYGVRGATDLDAALGGIEAIIVSSPTTTHEDYVTRLLPRIGAFFVEKPLTDRLESSRALGTAITAHGALLQVGFIERFNPAAQQLKELLDASQQVVTVDFARTNKISARITDVDVITDLMIHDIDLALYLNGPVSAVAAQGLAQGPMIDYASATLTHANGRFSRIQASRITDRKKRSIEATCVDGFIDCDLLRKEITLSRQAEEHQQRGGPYRITAIEEKIEVQPGEALMAELNAFVSRCRGKDVLHAPAAAEAIAAMEVCERIRAAI